MFSVYHVDKYRPILLCLKDTLLEAEAFVAEKYAGRFVSGKDKVVIQDEDGKTVKEWEVAWMPQFDAVPGKVWTFPSHSNPRNSYTTQINTTGIISCNCRAWAMGWKRMSHPLAPAPYRHCAHSDEVVSDEDLQVEISGPYMFISDKRLAAAKAGIKHAAKSLQDKFHGFLADYEQAKAALVALEPSDKRFIDACVVLQKAKFVLEACMAAMEGQGLALPAVAF